MFEGGESEIKNKRVYYLLIKINSLTIYFLIHIIDIYVIIRLIVKMKNLCNSLIFIHHTVF